MTCIPIINCTQAKCQSKILMPPPQGEQLVREQADPLQEEHREGSGGGEHVRCKSRPGCCRQSWRISRFFCFSFLVAKRTWFFLWLCLCVFCCCLLLLFLYSPLVLVVIVVVTLSAEISFIERKFFVQVQWCPPVHNGEAPPTAGRVHTAVFSAVYPVDCTRITPK